MGADLVIQAIQRLIDRYGAHAIINGYNAGTLTVEYDTIADAGIIYMHQNTDIVQHKTVGDDPEKYFGVFMGDPAEYVVRRGLRRVPSQSRKIRTVEAAEQQDRHDLRVGQQRCNGRQRHERGDQEVGLWLRISIHEVIVPPISEWGPTLEKIRADDSSIINMVHWFPQDGAQFMLQFTKNPTDSIIYMRYGPSLQASATSAERRSSA